jgi:hypothetical protein
MTADERIARALEIAHTYGGTDGEHHKQWVIDQMVRALTGCPMEKRQNTFGTYEVQGESDEYREWVTERMAGEDGPHTYDWDTGTAP